MKKTNQMTFRKIIDELLILFRQSKKTERYFSESINRLIAIKERMYSNCTRVAVIGITSSGKSTLINAILGEELLPAGVAPSSCRQVICGYSKITHAKIIFDEESGKNTLNVTKKISKTLSKYGDERCNPRNKERVNEIQVYSNKFRFNRNVIFIDTPGLDAYGLGEHEEITLKLVLPTVDIIIFLTNVKCDSDKQNLDFIDRATADSKPLIIVQNKIDSIEPKISRNHHENKSKEEVSLEHYHRIERLRSNAKKNSVKTAPIVQIAAKMKDNESNNLKQLSAVLDEQIELNAAHRIVILQNQLWRELKSLQQSLNKYIASETEKMDKIKREKEELAKTNSKLDKCSAKLDNIKNEINQNLDDIANTTSALIQAIEQKYKNDNPESIDTEIKSSKNKLEGMMKESISLLNDSISKINNAILCLANELNLTEAQVMRCSFPENLTIDIPDSLETKTKRRKVKQSGIVGCFKRGWGWVTNDDTCGYEYYDETINTINIKKLKNDIKTNCNRCCTFLQDSLKSLFKNSTKSINRMSNEIDSLSREIENRNKIVLQPKISATILLKIDEILSSSPRIASEKESISNAIIKTCAVKSESEKFEELDPLTYSLYSYAYKNSFAMYCEYRNIILKRAMEPLTKKVAVIGWDNHLLERFASYFFSDILTVSSGVSVVNSTHEHSSDYTVQFIDASSQANLPDTMNNSVLFVLVNAEQSGSMESKLNEVRILNFLKRFNQYGKIVWVMDSISEHISSSVSGDDLIEAFVELIRLGESITGKGKLFEVMASHRDLYYSVLFHELYFKLKKTILEKDRQNFIYEMEKCFKLNQDWRHKTGNYLSNYNIAGGFDDRKSKSHHGY